MPDDIDDAEPAAPRSEVIAYLRPSPARRAFGALMLVALGVILIYIAFFTPPALGWQLFLIGFGAGALYLALRLWQATATTLELTRTVLREANGRVLAEVADITRVDRGVFAFKPSNGFILTLRRSAGPRAWAPGLWWRLGWRIGVGGVTSGQEARTMAEILTLVLQDRDAGRG